MLETRTWRNTDHELANPSRIGIPALRCGTYRALRRSMMKTVKHSIHTIGDRGGDFVRTVGPATTDLARRFGNRTVKLAKQVGPRRALIGLAVLAAVIGGSVVLGRHLRARKLRRLNETADTSTGHTSKSGTRSPGQRPADVYSH